MYLDGLKLLQSFHLLGHWLPNLSFHIISVVTAVFG